MKYTAERIKPKKHPDEKPSESGFNVQYRVLLDDGRQALFDWNPVTPSETMMTWDRYVTWFIDIPNPPSELKFLAYPQNKPKEAGLYLVHYKPADDWGDIYYPDDNIWDEHIDYFIPYRLDEPVSDTDELDEPLGNSEQLEREDKVTYKPKDKFSDYTDEDLLLELINRNVMFEAPKKTERFVRHYEVIVGIGDDNTASIILPQDSLFELREIVYDKQSNNPCQLERENEMDVKVFMDWDNKTGDVNITKPVRLEQGDFMAVVRRYLDNFSYDVVKREPELKDCPNLECACRQAVYVKENIINSDDDYVLHYVLCEGCGYCGPEAKTPQEAIRLHNLIAKNAKRSSLFELENEYYGLWCDEDGNVLPRKES